MDRYPSMLTADDCDALRRDGYLVGQSLLPLPLLEALSGDCRALQEAGALSAAAVGRGQGRLRDGELRGDSTCWIEASAEAPQRAAFLAAMDEIRLQLNRRLLLGLHSLEAHYAVYPPGTGYRRHRDRFRDDDARTVSFTAYLNPAWQVQDGGALRLFLPEGQRDIPPRLGTCTLFLSAEIEHAVLPTRCHRYSIAGWFRRREALPW